MGGVPSEGVAPAVRLKKLGPPAWQRPQGAVVANRRACGVFELVAPVLDTARPCTCCRSRKFFGMLGRTKAVGQPTKQERSPPRRKCGRCSSESRAAAWSHGAPKRIVEKDTDSGRGRTREGLPLVCPRFGFLGYQGRDWVECRRRRAVLPYQAMYVVIQRVGRYHFLWGGSNKNKNKRNQSQVLRVLVGSDQRRVEACMLCYLADRTKDRTKEGQGKQ